MLRLCCGERKAALTFGSFLDDGDEPLDGLAVNDKKDDQQGVDDLRTKMIGIRKDKTNNKATEMKEDVNSPGTRQQE